MTAIALSAALLAALTCVIVRDYELQSGFNRVAMGETQADVVRNLGEPHGVVKCGEFGGVPPTGCEKELSYISPLTFWDIWTVSFDSQGRVIGKYLYMSP